MNVQIKRKSDREIKKDDIIDFGKLVSTLDDIDIEKNKEINSCPYVNLNGLSIIQLVLFIANLEKLS
jgi:hypothetical protein